MRKTIPLATAIAVLAAVTIVTGLVRNDVSLDSKTTAAPVAPLQTAAGTIPSRLRVASFGAL
jgi:hypothetical protein